MLIAGIATFVMGGRIVSATYADNIFDKLQKSATIIEGVIVNNEPNPDGHGFCDITYEYEEATNNGEGMKYSQEVKAQLCKLQPGTAVSIRYDSTNPNISQLDVRGGHYSVKDSATEFYIQFALIVTGALILNSMWLEHKYSRSN
ncbi:MAG: DUF3592 domain-containing protein [Deltaproteobacteria bacterium]|nr:DUF3592 domain-containing protein [Deltaproteobacteria bacterium]